MRMDLALRDQPFNGNDPRIVIRRFEELTSQCDTPAVTEGQ